MAKMGLWLWDVIAIFGCMRGKKQGDDGDNNDIDDNDSVASVTVLPRV